MATYRVMPLPDKVSPGYAWKVHKDNVGMKSHHRKKVAAERAARKLGRTGDSLAIHDANGQVLRWHTMQ